MQVHIKLKNAVYIYEKSHESLLQEIYTHKVLRIAFIPHIAKLPFRIQTFNNLTNMASGESGLILICSSIFQT